MSESNDPGRAPPPGPTLADRLRVTRDFQAQASRRTDPLEASLGVLTADVMAMAHAAAVQVDAALAGSAAPLEDPRFGPSAALLMTCLRYVDRMAPHERRAAAALPPSSALRPYREERRG